VGPLIQVIEMFSIVSLTCNINRKCSDEIMQKDELSKKMTGGRNHPSHMRKILLSSIILNKLITYV